MAITYKKKLFNCSIISTTYLKIIEISKDFPILNNYQLNNKINKIIKLELSIISFKMKMFLNFRFEKFNLENFIIIVVQPTELYLHLNYHTYNTKIKLFPHRQLIFISWCSTIPTLIPKTAWFFFNQLILPVKLNKLQS